jgi:hypothetical protein
MTEAEKKAAEEEDAKKRAKKDFDEDHLPPGWEWEEENGEVYYHMPNGETTVSTQNRSRSRTLFAYVTNIFYTSRLTCSFPPLSFPILTSFKWDDPRHDWEFFWKEYLPKPKK